MIRGERYSWKKLKKNMCLSHGSILHNRNLFTKNGLFDISYRICADYELLVRNGEFWMLYSIQLQSFKCRGEV